MRDEMHSGDEFLGTSWSGGGKERRVALCRHYALHPWSGSPILRHP